MSTVTTTRQIRLTDLGFPAVMRGDGDVWEVEADVEQAELEAAVASAREPFTPAVPAGVLDVDRYTVPADGTTCAVARYGSAEDVHFVVDGVVHDVAPVDEVATLEVAMDAPGSVIVRVRDRTFVLIAEEA